MGSSSRMKKKRYATKRRCRKRTYNNVSSNASAELDHGNDGENPTSSNSNNNDADAPDPVVMEDTSSARVDDSMQQDNSTNINDEEDMFFFMNYHILSSIIEQVGKCPECSCSITLKIDTTRKMGLAQQMKLECCCGWIKTIYSSPRIKDDDKSRFDINIRTIIAFREIGKGHSAIETFCSHMNMPPPITMMSYTEIKNEIHPYYVKAADESMQQAAETVHKGELTDIDASFDGTWQRRGFASLNGIVTCIERINNKVIDVEVKTKTCPQCTHWSTRKKDTTEYKKWETNHAENCLINFHGSASSMESTGAVDIFTRSIERRNLRYKTFIGDGDSSSFSNVTKADPYPGLTIKKGECIGHVQKRVGTNLRKLRKELPKARKDALFGRGKLTIPAIDYIQRCYGMAIRQNAGNLYQMKKNVSAIMFHCSDIENPEDRHKWCLRGEDSWCGYWNSSSNYIPKLNLPPSIKDEPEIKGLMERLRSNELLSKCLHGKTQNVNESLNNIIWTRCPKTVYVNRKTLEIGVSSAVLEFNEGKKGINAVMTKAGLNVGYFQSRSYDKLFSRKKRHIDRKSFEANKRRRKDLRSIRKGFMESDKQKEGKTYQAGGF